MSSSNPTSESLDGVTGHLWNPYVAGLALGLVLLAAFLVLGHGIGASGAAARLGTGAVSLLAPEHAAANPVMGGQVKGGANPLTDWLVFMVVGIFLGGALSSMLGGRQKAGVTRGPRISVPLRLTLAVSGGILMGFAARLARGCTSGQALSGGALLSVGSWIFMLCVFGGGYALAWFLRRQWR